MTSLDERLFRAINEWPDGLSPFLTFFSIALNQLWVKVVLGGLVVGMIIAKPVTRKAAIQALMAVGIANTLTDQFKHFMPMNRPYQDLAAVISRVGTGPSHGTASAHSANMAAVALVFVYHLRWWGTPWVLIALLTGLSRVYVGAHYPSQVGLGWACGIFSAYFIARGWDVIQSKRSAVIVGEGPHESAETI